MTRRLVRDFIHRALYPTAANLSGPTSSSSSSSSSSMSYFSQPVVSTFAEPINFASLAGEGEYRKLVADLYRYNDMSAGGGEWLTPSEVFKPAYSQAIARYMLAVAGNKQSRESKARKKNRGADASSGSSVSELDPLRIVEVGGGTGTNAASILDYLRDEAPERYSTMSYLLLEISPALAEQQRERLAQAGHEAVSQVVVADALSEFDAQQYPARPGPGLSFSASASSSSPAAASSASVLLDKVFSRDRHGVCVDRWFVLGLEVLDNLPHDKVVEREDGGGWYEVHVEAEAEVDEGAANGTEGAEPSSAAASQRPRPREIKVDLQDPLIAKAAEHYAPPVVPPPQQSNDDRGGGRRRPPGRHPREVFVPTGAVALMSGLIARLPRHHVIFADFSFLPPPSLGLGHGLVQIARRALGLVPPRPVNEPLVASRDAVRGTTVDRESYLDADGSTDIFFPTHFQNMAKCYEALWEEEQKRKEQEQEQEQEQNRQQEQQGQKRRKTRKRRLRVRSSKDFLAQWAPDVRRMTTRTGYCPMLEDFTNTCFITNES